MAKVVKSERKIANVEEEIKRLSSTKKNSKKEKIEVKKDKKSDKKKNDKKEKSGIRKLLCEVRKEMSKVKWPNKKDMGKYSLATIVFIIFFGIFFYVIEIIMALLKAWV